MTSPRVLARLPAAVLVMVLGTNAPAQQLDARSPPHQATLVELFTSEGCSSCPPAEAWMNGLETDPRLWSDLVPVAFHVDYWDYIGWPDRFALPEHSRRQRDYARAGLVSSVYTPGLLANGREWRGWFRSPVLRTPIGPEVGRLELHVRDGHLTARFEPTGPARELLLNVAVLGFDLSTQVRAGENSGRSLQHHFVVMGFNRLPMSPRGAAHVASGALPDARLTSPRSGVAAWVSEAGSPRPLQATGGMLVP